MVFKSNCHQFMIAKVLRFQQLAQLRLSMIRGGDLFNALLI